MRTTTVTCPYCHTRYDSDAVPFVNISEDIQGYDVMTFECPKCEKVVDSYVRS